MKTLHLFLTFAVLITACAIVSASETSDNFAKWVPDFTAPDLDKRKDSQQNWQTLCQQKGNDPEIRKEIIRVSVEQLAKDNPVDTTVWIVRQLGIAGDATAVPALEKCLTSNEIRIRDEAARALANIPGKEAEGALKKSNLILTSQLTKDALTSRAIKADIPKDNIVETQLLLAIPNFPVSRTVEFITFLEGYGKLSDMEKAQVLSNLTARDLGNQISRAQRRTSDTVPGRNTNRHMPGNQYVPLAVEAAQSSDETLRNEGLLAIGALGGTKEIPFLLEQARIGANKDLAKLVLSRMNQKGTDTALLEILKSEQNNEKFLILADVLNRRYNSSMRPILLDRAKVTDTPNRLQLLQTVEPISTKADIDDFVKTWTLITDRGQKDLAEQCIARLSAGDADAALQALGSNWDAPENLSLLGRIGDTKTIDKIRQSKSAVRAFVNWPNARVADDLFAIASSAESPEADQIAALRAFTRVMSLPNDQIDDTEKVKRLADAYALAKRVEDKRFIIERVGQIRNVESLRFVLQYFDETELQESVCSSILDLAHQVELKRSARDEFNTALDKVLSITKQNDFRDRANRYKGQQ